MVSPYVSSEDDSLNDKYMEEDVPWKCSYCGSEDDDNVKYGSKEYCSECQETFIDPSQLYTYVEVDLNEDRELLVRLTLLNKSPLDESITVPSKEVSEGTVYAEVTIESESGFCTDVFTLGKPEKGEELSIKGIKSETIRYPDNPEQNVRDHLRKIEGDVLGGNEIDVTVTFYCSDIESCSETFSISQKVAEVI